jgi:hypothetical protein
MSKVDEEITPEADTAVFVFGALGQIEPNVPRTSATHPADIVVVIVS